MQRVERRDRLASPSASMSHWAKISRKLASEAREFHSSHADELGELFRLLEEPVLELRDDRGRLIDWPEFDAGPEPDSYDPEMRFTLFRRRSFRPLGDS